MQRPQPEDLKLVIWPDPILKRKAIEVEDPKDPELNPLIDRMLEIMYTGNGFIRGIGLAANQANWKAGSHSLPERVIVLDPFWYANEEDTVCGKAPVAIINPVIVEEEGRVVGQEGCLSFPAIIGQVTRSQRIIVEGYDRDGEPMRREVVDKQEGMLCRAIQHEIDHLNGRNLPDFMSSKTRGMAKEKLQLLESQYRKAHRPRQQQKKKVRKRR